VIAIVVDVDFLSGSQHWFADGTFRVTPAGFDQLYTIHAFVDGQTYPCVFAPLPARTEAVYQRLLQELGNLGLATAPIAIMTDFEMAAINAFRKKFPGNYFLVLSNMLCSV